MCNMEKKQTISTASLCSANSLLEDDSFELIGQSDEEHINEHHELTEEEIEEMLLENAEVLEERGKSVMGVNFRRFIPKCDFIKDSAVFHVLQEEQVHKELSEKEQLQKCPEKRFSTFLWQPNRPIPEQKSKVRKEKETENEQNKLVVRSEQQMLPPNSLKKQRDTDSSPIIETNQNENESDQDEINNSVDNIEPLKEEENSTTEMKNEELTNINEAIVDSTEIHIEEARDNSATQLSNDFENQLNQIRNTLTLLGELPSLIQSQLATVQSQINNLLQLKEDQENTRTNPSTTSNCENEQIQKTNSITIEEIYSHEQSAITEDFSDFINDESTQIVQNESINRDEIEETETRKEQRNEENNQLIETDQNQQIEDEDAEERELHRRRICPLTPLPRPVVLPGGRIWRKPKDAYNEEFIAETLISQAEVLVGSTLGVNFRKYEPPKFDLSNSAVYKLIHNLEGTKKGLEERDTIPSLQDYYQPPIDAKHFYLASLADKVQEMVEFQEKENN